MVARLFFSSDVTYFLIQTNRFYHANRSSSSLSFGAAGATASPPVSTGADAPEGASPFASSAAARRSESAAASSRRFSSCAAAASVRATTSPAPSAIRRVASRSLDAASSSSKISPSTAALGEAGGKLLGRDDAVAVLVEFSKRVLDEKL